MDALNEDNYSGKAIDHLGLVADIIDDLDIIQLIDDRLPLTEGCGSKVTMGERVAAMILNGLGFVDTRLYMFPEFIEKKPIKRLFGREIDPKWFNDDSLGRCLDDTANYGTTKIFTELSVTIGSKKKLLGTGAHFDTSTLQLYGEYPGHEVKSCGDDKELMPAIPAQGYSKSHRPDLKQMVITLATTGKANFPIWMESHSGNVSDKKVLPDAAQRMQKFYAKIKEMSDFLYVGDSAIYSNILPLSNDMKWLTRVPDNILQAKQLTRKENNELNWQPLQNGYSYHVTESNYGDVNQRWLLIFSEQAYKREIRTLERNINKEFIQLEKECRTISKELLSCLKDAQSLIKKLKKKGKYHIINAHVSEVFSHSGCGRPKKGTKPTAVGYKIECNILKSADKIHLAKLKKGRFILSTNELDKDVLPDNQLLSEYKKQSGTESGFKFIKDNTFEVDSVFLQTPSRIDALMMIMTLCLMVYGYTQYALRKALEESNETIPDQKRKPTVKPSIKWVYFLFLGVHELTISIADEMKQIVINLNTLLKKIVRYFGPRAQEIYFNSS